MKVLAFITLFLALPFLAPIAHAQEAFRGIVVDSASLEALPFVNVQLKNTGRGTTTDEKGGFLIEASPRDTLLFSLVGYETLELPLATYEPGLIRLSEKYTLLQAITIDEYRRENLYEGMFDEENPVLERQRLPFYFSKTKKQKIRLEGLKLENQRVQTYVDVVVNNPELKTRLMTTYGLTQQEYYDVLRAFNETHYRVMYYLTRAELLSLINNFFESRLRNR